MEVVTEFFGYAINSILYQRGIYPPESFTSVAKYGLSVLVTSDEGLKSYLVQVLRQLAEWLTKGEVQKLIVVITGVESKEVLERWVFNIDTDKAAMAPGVTRVKSHKDIQGEIQAIIRQVTACVTFLPLLEEACSFDLLVYADTVAKVPAAWEESDPKVRGEEGAPRCTPHTGYLLSVLLWLQWRAHTHANLLNPFTLPVFTSSTLQQARRFACGPSPRPSTRWRPQCRTNR